jgi:hypothetical protein
VLPQTNPVDPCPIAVPRNQEPQRETSLSLTNLIIGSVSSAAAAVIVHRLWRAGAILGAAATPVLMALFAEALRRPAERVTVRTRRTPARRASLLHPSLPRDVSGETIRIYRSRPRWGLAVLSGLTAFALGAAGLTVSEALLHRSVADSGARTTLFDARPPRRAAPPPKSEPGARPAGPASERARDDRLRRERRDRRSGAGPANPQETPSPTPDPTPTPSPTPPPPPQAGPTPVPPQPTPARTGSGGSEASAPT